MIVPGYYQVTSMAPGWILKSHAQKIGRNYGIVLAKINHRSTAPPDTIFFSIFWDLERQPNRRKRYPIRHRRSAPRHKTKNPNSYRRSTTSLYNLACKRLRNKKKRVVFRLYGDS